MSNHRSLKSPSPYLFKKPGRSNSVDQSGGNSIDEEQFEKSFEDVPTINIYSAKDVTDRLTKIKETITDADLDWEKRTNALKELRSLVNGGHITNMTDLTQHLRSLDIGLQTSLKDLRSQVVREACITIAYLCKELEMKFETSSELLLQILINLMQNTAKVMANSAIVCIKFILKFIHSSRLVTIISTNLSSKSNIIRKYCCEFICIVLSDWSKVELQRQMTLLHESIKKGLVDADAEARMHARKAFANFSMHFPELGYSLLSSFDPSKQKQLLAELDDPDIFSGVSSSSSAAAAGSRSKSTDRSNGYQSTPLRKNNNIATSCHPDVIPISKTPKLTRTRSIGGKDGIRLKNQPMTPSSTIARATPRTVPKTKISQSQPSSRSGSPNRTPLSSKMVPPDLTANNSNGNYRLTSSSYMRTLPSSVKKVDSTSSRKYVCQSQGNSRDTSPERRELKYNGLMTIRRGSDSTTTTPLVKKQPQQLTYQHIEDYSRDLEAAVAGAWSHSRELRRSLDDEGSSVCSESSFKSYSDVSEDFTELINSLTIGSWADRREGLIKLQRSLRSERKFNLSELKRLTEVLTRFFHDPHPKVLTQFLEVLVDLLYSYSFDLINWQPIIMNRLISKAGSDVLGSLQAKINDALCAVRDTFPEDSQLSSVMKFIVEQQQTVNIRIKSSIMKHLLSLIHKMDPSLLINNSDTRLAVSKIVTWTSEPKSADIRKLAQSVILALDEKNPTEFNKIISALPKSFQDTVRKVFADSKQNNNFLNVYRESPCVLNKATNQVTDRKRSSSRSSNPSPNREAMRERSNYINNNSNNNIGGDYNNKNNNIWYNNNTSTNSMSGYGDVFDGIRKTTEDIQQLSLMGVQDESFYNNGDPSSYDYDYINKEVSTWDSADLGALIEEIRSCDNIEEWSKGMNQMVNVSRLCDNEEVWETHFKMVLLLLLESMQDQENCKRRSSSLRVMKELLERQHVKFQPYAELTIMNLLEFEKDSDREVQKSADDCTSVLSRVIPFDQLISILNPITMTAEFPINLAAIKLLTKVIQNADVNNVKENMATITPGLIKGFENNESSVRKASMTCLLAIYKHVGDQLMPLLQQLNPSKMKLLNLYIKRGTDDPTTTTTPNQ